jgi:deoxyribodipyrimidine photo-lyase
MRAVHWFRGDLRLSDNTALSEAASRAAQLVPLFVFDERLLRSPKQGRGRVRFLRDCVERLAAELRERGCPLAVRRGDPRSEVPRLLAETKADLVTWNRDGSPYARRRDAAVEAAAQRLGVRVVTCKDRVVFESREVLSAAEEPFRVYGPFRRAWWRRFEEERPVQSGPLRLPAPVPGVASGSLPPLAELGADRVAARLPSGGERAARRRLRAFLERDVAGYAERRNFPAEDATSRLSPHLRFGTISVRRCIDDAFAAQQDDRRRAKGVQSWLGELVWREFYAAILAEHPHVLRRAWRTEFDAVVFDDDERLLRAWREGRTGFPFVDAAMRQLVGEGWMHNRARMVVASFLTKDLLVDWRLGERVFMEHLVDMDPASNNGGWQWAASTGTDAQPFFRIFNPVRQGERFDPEGAYVRRWVPELRALAGAAVHRPWDAPLAAPDYPPPVVDHTARRALALRRYEAARGASRGQAGRPAPTPLRDR